MSELVKPLAEWCMALIEALGVAIITLMAIYALLRALIGLLGKQQEMMAFEELRRRLGRGILVGLEFLVAADIIQTVAIELTFESVGLLAIIILIRTFLSFALEVELTGRWPWQHVDPSKTP
jgi:uncharacterized membrane protein